MNAGVFLDRDGTLIVQRHFLKDPDEVELLPGAGPALQRLCDAGFQLFLVTNQSGIGRGLFTLEDVERVHARLLDLLAPNHVTFQHIYIAPEGPDQPSPGRKPSPHFLRVAGKDWGLDLGASYMVGDKLLDLECGWNAGVRRSLLVRTGYGVEVERTAGAALDRAVVVDDMTAAVDWILGDAG
jgi:D-glycero-D-manno-heptose 1,7-bisphosphate phosphatase